MTLLYVFVLSFFTDNGTDTTSFSVSFPVCHSLVIALFMVSANHCQSIFHCPCLCHCIFTVPISVTVFSLPLSFPLFLPLSRSFYCSSLCHRRFHCSSFFQSQSFPVFFPLPPAFHCSFHCSCLPVSATVFFIVPVCHRLFTALFTVPSSPPSLFSYSHVHQRMDADAGTC